MATELEILDKLLQCWGKGCNLFDPEFNGKYNVFITDQIKANIKSYFGGGEIGAQIANIIWSCFFRYVTKCIPSLAVLEAIEKILTWKSEIPETLQSVSEKLQKYIEKMTKHKTEMEGVMTELFEIEKACNSTSRKLSQTEEKKIIELKKKFKSESDDFEVECKAARKALDRFQKGIERRRQLVQWGLTTTTVFVGGVSLLAVGPALAAGTTAAAALGRICIPRWLVGSSLVAYLFGTPTLIVILCSYNSKLEATSELENELENLESDFDKLKKKMERFKM